MSKPRQQLEIAAYHGINLNNPEMVGMGELIGGKNFQIGRDGFIERTKGSVLAFDGHGISTLTDIYFHEDITGAMMVFGFVGSNRRAKSQVGGEWVNVLKFVNIDVDLKVGDTDVRVDSASGFVAGDSIFICDNANSETATVSKIVDLRTIRLTVGLSKSYKVDLNARLTFNSATAGQALIHVGGYNDWTSYLKTPVWATGGDIFAASNFRQTVGGADSKAAFSINDINRAYYLDNGGSSSVYRSLMGASVCEAHDRLWLSGESDLENCVMYTQKYNYLFYDIGIGNIPFLNFLSIGGDDSGSGSISDKILKIIPVADQILVLKQKSVHIIVGQERTTFQSIRLSDKIGCDNAACVKSTKAGIIWKYGESVYVYNGSGFPQEISIPRVSFAMNNSDPSKVVAGVSARKFYIISINDDESWRFDIEQNAWTFEDVNYHAFAERGDALYAITALHASIQNLDRGFTRQANADGTGGTAYDMEMEFPFINFGSKGVQKILMEVAAFWQTAESRVDLEANFDDRRKALIRGGCQQSPVWNRFYMGGGAPNPRLRYKQGFLDYVLPRQFQYEMPLESTCYSFKMAFRLHNPIGEVRLGNVIIYFVPTGTFQQEDN